eukprot:1161664-Pelagomonas_calceolata.AAC.17
MRSVGNRAKSVHAPIMKQLGSKANKREAGQKACIPFLIDGKRDRQLCASTYQETGGKQGRHHVRASGRLACKSSADLLLLLVVGSMRASLTIHVWGQGRRDPSGMSTAGLPLAKWNTRGLTAALKGPGPSLSELSVGAYA